MATGNHARRFSAAAVVIGVIGGIGLGLGCGSDDTGDGAGAGGTGGMGGSGAGAGGAGDGGGAGMCGDPYEGEKCANDGEPNLDCSAAAGPYTGPCAPQGECCRRSSNSLKLDALCDDAPGVIEYRLNSSVVANHPDTLGVQYLLDLAAERARQCTGEQCLLWRFTQPREGEEFVDGPGSAQIGIGRYNCDGTFSYYGDTVAPERAGHTDPARWAGVSVPTTFHAEATGVDQHTMTFEALESRRSVVCSPFLDESTLELDWELCSGGFEILSFDTSDPDCSGSFDGQTSSWEPGGQYQVFAPLSANNEDVINATGGSFCQLLAFGIGGTLDCEGEARCVPDGEGGCPWVKLPDSLCPETEEQRALFGCHLGARENVNQEAGYPSDIPCTVDAPTTPRDPEQGVTDQGQCCDPLGGGEDGLPPCNAYRIVNDFVAAAAEITDDPTNELPANCE